VENNLKYMEMKIKSIKNNKDYEEALVFIETLMDQNPGPDTEAGLKLKIVTNLVKIYESEICPESLPDPVDAILFRMEQEDLKPKDLEKYIGNRSKVSEVLSRKRPLTLSMIRALEAGLEIPAKILLKETDEFRNKDDINWSRFPVSEMIKRGYIKSKGNINIMVQEFFKPIGSPLDFVGSLHKTYYSSTRVMDKHALIAWSAMVIKKAQAQGKLKKYKKGAVNLSVMQKLVKLSKKENGPLLAKNFLNDLGIYFIIEPNFKQTYLDGAVLMKKDNPIIGLTLRYDRLDNFWFNLMHELSHVALHMNAGSNFIYDDLDNYDLSNKKEKEANQMASEALVPESKWESSPAKILPSSMAAVSLAKELGISSSIVAGKIRREGKNYSYLNDVISKSKVRYLFSDITWIK